MKFIIFIIYILLSNIVFANEDTNNEVDVINLHESKSLDQMVLDNLNIDDDTQNIDKSSSETDKNENNEVDIKQIEVIKDNFIFKNQTKDLKNYFDNMQKINSKILQKQIIAVLENLELNLEVEKDKEILFLITNYLKSIGQINKSYELIERYEINSDKNFNFYTGIKLNYLLSTFQLNEACNFKEGLDPKIKLDYFFLEKLDIFCLILKMIYQKLAY